jgi:lactam utilization protein B
MKHTVEVEFQDFGWQALNEAAEAQGVSVQEVIQHAAMYYLASADEGRISHSVPTLELSPQANRA